MRTAAPATTDKAGRAGYPAVKRAILARLTQKPVKEARMSVKFEITKNDKGEFHFKLVNAEGKTLLRSEGYNAKASCTNGVESVRKNAAEDKRYEACTASDGRPYFNLKASNGQIIGTSPMFADAAACDAAIAATKAGAADASVDDKS
jgi:uncharacterized protein YegP (UPF0339 family)